MKNATYQQTFKKMLFNARMAEMYTAAADKERRCGDFNGLADDFDRFAATSRAVTARCAAQCACLLRVVA